MGVKLLQNNLRKIQKTGISTYTVSLPKSWIVENKISAGDIVSIIEEKDKSLRINLGEKESEFKEEIIHVKDFKDEKEIIRKFIALYLNGTNKIVFISDKPIVSDHINNILTQVKKVIGFEVVEEDENKIVLQDFFTSDYLSIEKAIRRAYNISKLLLKESKRIFTKPGPNKNNTLLWEQEVDRLYLLVRRQLHFAIHSSAILKQLNLTLSECQYFLIMIAAIEKFADSFTEIVVSSNIRITKNAEKMMKLFEMILEAYDMAFSSVFSRDFNMANESLKKTEMFKQELTGLNWSGDEKKIYPILFHLHMAIKRVQEIAEVGIDIR